MKALSYYNDLLIRYPKTVSTLSSAVIASIGDIGAQTLEWYLNNKSLKKKNVQNRPKYRVDWTRNMKVFSYGLIFTGVPVHYWYYMCDRIPYLCKGSKWTVISKKVFLTQISLSPALTAAFFAYTQFLDHFGDPSGAWTSLRDEMKAKFGMVYIDSLKVWVPTNALVFGVIPDQWKVVFANSVATLWYFYLSYVKWQDTTEIAVEDPGVD